VTRRLTGFAAAFVLTAIALPLGVTSAAAAPSSAAITLSVTGITPQTPARSFTKQQLTISVSLQNNTAVAIDHITITAVRATPIFDQRSLDQAIARPATPDQTLLQTITPTQPLEFDAPADQAVTEDFVTTASTDITTNPGLCLCTDAIYPIYLTASVTVGGVTTTLATTQTYLPAFGGKTQPVPLKVGWLWPLLDVPHRLTSNSIFLDDNLATEVAPGGRLYRALTVIEDVAGSVPMTVVTDPNLIDELRVMAAGPYSVASGTTRTPAATIPGVGTAAAAAWLQRLNAVLTANPTTEIAFTPYGDPDVQSLETKGLSWTAGLSASAQAQDSAVLGGLVPQTDIAWPNGETASKDTIDALAAHGAKTVILNDKTLTGGATATPPPTALAKLSTPSGTVTAAVTSSTINDWASKVLSTSGPGTTAIPQLVAQVAIRSVEDLTSSRYIVIAPPRDVDTDPDVAADAILATSTAFWSSPLALRQATGNEAAAGHGSVKLAKVAGVPDASLDALQYVAATLPRLGTMFRAADRAAELGTLPQAMQLAASSSLSSDPTLSGLYATQLRNQVNAIRTAVRLITPRSERYTLTSNNSPLPISITNRLTVPVFVDIDCAAVGGILGFSADPVHNHQIGPGQTVQVPVPTHFARTGNIEVQVSLSTPNQLPLGQPIQLKVRSTALGTIGVVITTVAAVVLLVALLVRVIRRVRARDPKTSTS
jgi:hypothetical protein